MIGFVFYNATALRHYRNLLRPNQVSTVGVDCVDGLYAPAGFLQCNQDRFKSLLGMAFSHQLVNVTYDCLLPGDVDSGVGAILLREGLIEGECLFGFPGED